jgi:tetratricopeptide (TPR) repeat protein
MSVKYESDQKQFSRNLPEALAEVSAMIDHVVSEFGSNSPQLAECYLELRRFRLLPNREAHSDPNLGEASSNVISQEGAGSVENTLLGKYLLHDPLHQESRLRDIESALISSLDEWTDTNQERVKQALFVLLDLAACWEIIGNSSRAGDLTERVAGLCQQYLEPADALTVSALIDTAAYCVKRGKADEAESLLKAALDKCEANPQVMGRYGPRVLMNLAAVAASRGQAPIAAGYLDRALEAAEQAPELDRYHILEILCNQAKVCLAMKQRERFDRVASRALNEAKDYWKSDPDFATECMMILFGLYQAQGRFDEARSISRSLTEMMAQ